MDKAKEACENMAARKMNCSQAVLSSFCEEFGLERSLAFRLAQGLGGGMGHSGRTCGAVSGSYMVLGLAQKTTSENPRENIDKTRVLVNEFNRQFESLNSSVTCKELLGYDLSVPERLAEAREKGLFVTRCPIFVRDAVKIVESLLK